MSLSLWIILYSKLFLVYDTNWKRLLWATSTHCYPHLHTCTWMHAYTRTQVCFWVIWLPLLSFLQRFWFRQRCFLWVEIQMLMHLKQLWQQSNAAQQTKQNKTKFQRRNRKYALKLILALSLTCFYSKWISEVTKYVAVLKQRLPIQLHSFMCGCAKKMWEYDYDTRYHQNCSHISVCNISSKTEHGPYPGR